MQSTLLRPTLLLHYLPLMSSLNGLVGMLRLMPWFLCQLREVLSFIFNPARLLTKDVQDKLASLYPIRNEAKVTFLRKQSDGAKMDSMGAWHLTKVKDYEEQLVNIDEILLCCVHCSWWTSNNLEWSLFSFFFNLMTFRGPSSRCGNQTLAFGEWKFI